MTALVPLFFIFAIACVWHLVYEGIIAPSIRMKWRFELFALRDELRRLKIENADYISDELFLFTQERINNAIILLHRINAYVLFRARERYQASPCLAEIVEKNWQLSEKCQVERVHEINEALMHMTVRALIVNHGGWGPYIVPIIGLIFLFEKLSLWISKIVYMPNDDVQDITNRYSPA